MISAGISVWTAGGDVDVAILEAGWAEPCTMTDGTEGYIAQDFRRGCISYGETSDDALSSLELARRAWDAIGRESVEVRRDAGAAERGTSGPQTEDAE